MGIPLTKYIAEGPARDEHREEDARCTYKPNCLGCKSPGHRVNGVSVCVDYYFDEWSKLIDSCRVGR